MTGLLSSWYSLRILRSSASEPRGTHLAEAAITARSMIGGTRLGFLLTLLQVIQRNTRAIRRFPAQITLAADEELTDLLGHQLLTVFAGHHPHLLSD